MAHAQLDAEFLVAFRERFVAHRRSVLRALVVAARPRELEREADVLVARSALRGCAVNVVLCVGTKITSASSAFT